MAESEVLVLRLGATLQEQHGQLQLLAADLQAAQRGIERERDATTAAMQETDAHVLLSQTQAARIEQAEGEIARLIGENRRLEEENEELTAAQRVSAGLAKEEEARSRKMDELLVGVRTEACDIQGRLEAAEEMLTERNKTISQLQKFDTKLRNPHVSCLLYVTS